MRFLSTAKLVPTQYKIICGLDEVGRGPWAGPLVACALVLPNPRSIKECNDSKKLTAEKREKIFTRLKKKAVYGIGIVEVEELNRLNLIQATNMAMLRALEDLRNKPGSMTPEFLLIDGKDKLRFPYPFKTIIKGDEKIKIIACASIVAKVTRDRLMKRYAKKYPQYGFALHKGYGTKQHQQAIKQYGICELHRHNFQPIKPYLFPQQSSFL